MFSSNRQQLGTNGTGKRRLVKYRSWTHHKALMRSQAISLHTPRSSANRINHVPKPNNEYLYSPGKSGSNKNKLN